MAGLVLRSVMTSSKNRDQGYALDPRCKEVKIKDLTFWPNGNRGRRSGSRGNTRRGWRRGGSEDR
jgi:hypothetical protein